MTHRIDGMHGAQTVITEESEGELRGILVKNKQRPKGQGDCNRQIVGQVWHPRHEHLWLREFRGSAAAF